MYRKNLFITFSLQNKYLSCDNPYKQANWGHKVQKYTSVSCQCPRQSCWRNEGSMNRGMDQGRGLGLAEPFFSASSSVLELVEVFRILQKLELNFAK